MKIEKIHGLIAAPFTPMHPDRSINVDPIPAYASKLKKEGLSGAFICGTTGEGMLLTEKEREQIAEEWVKHQTPNFKIIVHVGTTSVKQSMQLAQHAQQIGAYAISTMGPIFLKPVTTEALVEFCVDVAKIAADLPFYYYHIPSLSGVDLPMKEFLRIAAKRIPNLAGLKFTHNDFMEMQQCLDLENGRWNILHGFDEMLLAGLVFGATGAVGSTYNYMAPLYQNLIKDFEDGNLIKARKRQLLSVAIVETLVKFGGSLIAGKGIMKLIGLDCGPCRRPLTSLSDESMNQMREELVQKGLYQLIEKTADIEK